MIHALVARATVALPGLEDAEALTGLMDPDAVLDFYLRLGPRVVALKMGARGTALLYRTPEQASGDNNTVDMDRERANFADNAVRYEATLRFINGGVRQALSAIRGE